MDYNLLLQLKDRANKVKTDLPPEVAAGFNDSFNVEYTDTDSILKTSCPPNRKDLQTLSSAPYLSRS